MTPKCLSRFDVGSKTKPTLQGKAKFSTAYLAHILDLGAIASLRTSTEMLEQAQWSHQLQPNFRLAVKMSLRHRMHRVCCQVSNIDLNVCVHHMATHTTRV